MPSCGHCASVVHIVGGGAGHWLIVALHWPLSHVTVGQAVVPSVHCWQGTPSAGQSAAVVHEEPLLQSSGEQ